MLSFQQQSQDAEAQDDQPQVPFCTSTRPTTQPANSTNNDRLIEHTESLFNRITASFDGFPGVLVARFDHLEDNLVAAIDEENMEVLVREVERGVAEVRRARTYGEHYSTDGGSLSGSGSVSSYSSFDDELYQCEGV